MRRIGVLMGFAESDREGQAFAAAFREGLQQLGWAEGRNIRIDTRWATPGGDAPSRQRLAQELVALRPDVILSGTTATTSALLQQTRTVPIVFATVADPVSTNFVASFPRPGGNVTGFITMEPTMAGKWLELLKEIAPRVARVAFLFNPATAPYFDYYLVPFKAAAASVAIEVAAIPVRDRSEFEAVIAAQARAPNSGLVVMPDPYTVTHREEITRWRRATVFRPYTRSVSSPSTAASLHTELIFSITTGVRRLMSTASSRAPSRASFRSRRRSSSN